MKWSIEAFIPRTVECLLDLAGFVHLDIYVSYKQVLLFTYTDGHWRQTYWHTSMADCYDINDYQLTLFCLHLV